MIIGLGILLLVPLYISAGGIGNGNNTQNWSEYVEQEGRFVLKYPNTWLLGEKFEIMNPEGLKFYLNGQEKLKSNEIMQIGIGHRDPSLSGLSIKNITKLRLDSALFINKFKGDFQNFSLQKNADFDKYRIDGHRTFYFEFSFIKSNVEKKAMFVATDIRNSIFYILFMPDQTDFGTLLPVAESLIASVQINNI